jgi:hypothetical protein
MMLKVKMRSKKLKKKIKNQLILIVQYVQYLKSLRRDWKKNRTLRKILIDKTQDKSGKGNKAGKGKNAKKKAQTTLKL